MSNLMIEISANEFQELTEALKKCREDKKKLIETVNFLNKEIEEFNKKFAEKTSKDSEE